MKEPHYAFYVLAEELEPPKIREILHALHLDQVWIRIVETGARYEDCALWQIEIFDVTHGQPVFDENIGKGLSSDERTALIVGIDPEEDEVACGLYLDGEEAFVFAGSVDEFEARDEETGQEYKGKDGFYEFFKVLTEASFDDFIKDPAVQPEARELADDSTALLLRGRVMRVPEGAERDEDVCIFHDVQQWQDEDENPVVEGEPDSDRVALVMLDPDLMRFLWDEAPAAQVATFLEAIAPVAPKVLGPLAGALDEAQKLVAQRPQDAPLGSANAPDLLCYEVISLATALGYLAGDSVAFYAERLLPLLSIGPDPASSAIIKDSVDEIADLPIYAAMTEVMPYSVPESELMECIADEELAPLAPWALRDGTYEGSLFLLDTRRLEQLLDEFSPEGLDRLADAFMQSWQPLARPELTIEAWKEERAELDGHERLHVGLLMAELAYLLALKRYNDLQPALLFYS
jgi:hypothetical protein